MEEPADSNESLTQTPMFDVSDYDQFAATTNVKFLGNDPYDVGGSIGEIQKNSFRLMVVISLSNDTGVILSMMSYSVPTRAPNSTSYCSNPAK